jgi:hypothetical protein
MLCVPYVGVNMSVSVSVTEMSTVRHYLYGLHVCLSSNIPLWRAFGFSVWFHGQAKVRMLFVCFYV